MKKKTIIGMGLFATLLALAKKSNASSNTFKKVNFLNENKILEITDDFTLRKCDTWGCGHFHANRGNRKHQGIDVSVIQGQPLFSPITGKFIRESIPYGNDRRYKGVEIQGVGIHKKFRCKIFYCTPAIPLRSNVIAGDKVATAQNIAKKYGKRNGQLMTNHVHFELYKNGKKVDPTKYF